MATEYKFGKMERNMREIGKMIKLMVKEHLSILTVINLLENGNIIKQMVSELIMDRK